MWETGTVCGDCGVGKGQPTRLARGKVINGVEQGRQGVVVEKRSSIAVPLVSPHGTVFDGGGTFAGPRALPNPRGSSDL